MKRIFFLLLISILSLNLFAHTKMYHVGLSANFLSYIDEEDSEPTVDELVSGNSDEPLLDDSLQCFNFSAGFSIYFDKDDKYDKFMPLFDFQAGLGWGTPYGIGWYTQYLGGISFRPISLLFLDLSAGAKLTGAWHTFEYVIVPDTYWLDIIVDCSLSLNFFYSFGLKAGIFMNFGSSGFDFFPSISILIGEKNK